MRLTSFFNIWKYLGFFLYTILFKPAVEARRKVEKMSTPKLGPPLIAPKRRPLGTSPPERRWDIREIEALREFTESMRIAGKFTSGLNQEEWSWDSIMIMWSNFFTANPRLAPRGYSGEMLYERRPFKFRFTTVRFFQMVAIFGPPDALLPTMLRQTVGKLKKTGQAIWIRPEVQIPRFPKLSFLSELRVYDTYLAHFDPAPHVDFLFTKMEVPYQRKKDMYKLQKLSDSITVDLRFRTVSSGCHFLPANLVSHYVTCMYLNGEISSMGNARTLYAQKIAELAEEFRSTSESPSYLMMPAHQYVISYLLNVHHSHVRPIMMALDVEEKKNIPDTPPALGQSGFVVDPSVFEPLDPLEFPEDFFESPEEGLGDSIPSQPHRATMERLKARRKPASEKSVKGADSLTRPRISSRRLGV